MRETTTFGEHTGNEWARVFTDTITRAFSTDPTWAPIIEGTGSPKTPFEYWDFFVRSSQRFPWMGSVNEGEAVTVWLPPGAAELTPAEEEEFPNLAQEWFGQEAADELFRIIERFDEARPDGNYFYLSLLATHPDSYGRGLGMGLLKANLAELDRLGEPSYLESSNPANDGRYERLGYRRHGTISLPSGLELSTFWRDPQPEQE